jgi:hypothetical protein
MENRIGRTDARIARDRALRAMEASDDPEVRLACWKLARAYNGKMRGTGRPGQLEAGRVPLCG